LRNGCRRRSGWLARRALREGWERGAYVARDHNEGDELSHDSSELKIIVCEKTRHSSKTPKFFHAPEVR
ncbi:MAG: hypothetical protein ABR554_01855, partial [Pyrinomonadaceae bacterium]